MHTCRGISDHVDVGSSKGRGGPDSVATSQTLRTHDLVSMAQQVLKAIMHLHRFGVIHKDVATRNCLVAEVPALGLSDRLHIQLCDAALSRDIFRDDYYAPSDAPDDTVSRPVKWLAPGGLKCSQINNLYILQKYYDPTSLIVHLMSGLMESFYGKRLLVDNNHMKKFHLKKWQLHWLLEHVLANLTTVPMKSTQ